MALDTQVSIHGILEFGAWTAVAGSDPTNEYDEALVYTLTPWGYTSEEGARITPNVTTVTQRSGQSAAVVSSFISEASAQLGVRLLSASLLNLKRLMGLPDTALTGDLTADEDETLIVRGAELGSVEQQLYLRTMGPFGPRTYYMPRAKVASFPEITHARTEFFEPNATFDLLENEAGQMFWIHDPTA